MVILPVKLWAMRSKRTSDDFLDPPGLLLVLPFNKFNLDFLKNFTRIWNKVLAFYTLLYICTVLFQFVV
jgi:hypothetical protein